MENYNCSRKIKNEVKKKRGGYLSCYLLILGVLKFIGLCILCLLIGESSSFIIVPCIINVLYIIFLIAIYRFKKWGIVGYLILWVSVSIMTQSINNAWTVSLLCGLVIADNKSRNK